jgi:WD40 repeat protein
MIPTRRRLLAVWATLLLATAAQGEPPVRPSSLALPPGACARLDAGSNPFLCMAFSPDSKRLAAGGYDKTIRIWDVATAKEVLRWKTPEGNLGCLAFSPDGRLLASGVVLDPGVRLWEAATGRPVRVLEGLPRGTSSLAFSPDGKLLAAGGYRTAEVHLWHVANGQSAGRLVPSAAPSPNINFPTGDAPAFSYAAFAPDGKSLAVGHVGGLIRLWDPASRRELRQIQGFPDDVFVHVAFSPDGRLLASCGTTVRLWQVDGGKQLRYFGAQPDLRIVAAAFSTDGRMLASGSSSQDVGDVAVHLWETSTGAERCRLEGHRYAIASLAFSPDRTVLASGSHDGSTVLWNLRQLPLEASRVGRLSTRALEEYWRDLADSDAPRAYRAVRALAHDPGSSVPLFRERLRPVSFAGPERIHAWIAVLDSSWYRGRQEAIDELLVQAEVAEPVLRKVLAGRPSVEVRRRLAEILGAKEQGQFSPRQLRLLRAVEALEDAGTKEAQEVLATLAQGTPAFRITREARAALDRLARRSTAQP